MANIFNKISAWDLNVLLKLNNAFSHFNGFLNKFLAEYLTYILPIVLLVLWFNPQEKAKKTVLRAVTSVILAWPILSYSIGHLVNRQRPFDITGVQELVFHRPTFSFPSDHAATLFAVAMSFYLSGYKKLSYFMFAIAIVICFFRVATGIHWPTDILAGAAIGLLSAWIIQILDGILDPAYEFIINKFQKIKLA
jgi:undecaprenyl-diphosphatase